MKLKYLVPLLKYRTAKGERGESTELTEGKNEVRSQGFFFLPLFSCLVFQNWWVLRKFLLFS